MKVRTFYTDGATSNNGYENSSGGFGVIELDEQNNICYEYQEFKAPTTNNEMELMAILHTLQYIQKESNNFIKPIIYTDSTYCYNIITNWMYSWEKNNWLRPKNQEIKNLEIIKQIYNLASLAEIKKVKGHNGNLGNELADQLATGRRKINVK